MTARRYDAPEEPVEVTEEHLMTETGHYRSTTLNMNQVTDGDLTANIFTPINE